MEHREYTLMFTDIVGYSRLMGRDQNQTIAMLEDYRRILLEQIRKFDGTVIEFIGDAVFARFDKPDNGMNAAIAIQKALFSFNHFRDKTLPALRTRIGLHTGDVCTKNGALFGDNVNIAARLEPIAVADSICVSHTVYNAVKENLSEPVLKIGVQPLKNIESKIKAYVIRPLGIGIKTRAHYLNRKINHKVGAYRYPIAASFALLIALAIYFVPRWLVPGYDANYVEIASFENLMDDEGENDYLSNGITEALKSQLADVRDVYLVDADEGIQAPIRLTGSVQKVGYNLRIAYQIFRRRDNAQIAGGKLDGKFDDILILQDRVTAEIASHLADEFGLPNFRPAAIDYTADVLAYDYYLRGMDYLNEPSSEFAMDEAINNFTTALIHDEKFSLANTGMCKAYWQKHNLTQINQFIQKAEKHCREALVLSPNLNSAIEALGIVYTETGRYEAAEKLLIQSIEEEVNSVSASISLALLYGRSDRVQEAIEILNELAETNPLYWKVYQSLGFIYLESGYFDEAVSQYDKVLKLTPNNSVALSNKGAAYFYLGNMQAAALAFEKSVKLFPSGWAYSNAGSVFYYAKNYLKAQDMFKEALRLTPDDFIVYLNLADTQRQVPQLEEESRNNYKLAYDKAIKRLSINDKDIEAYSVAIKSSFFLGLQEDALTMYELAKDLEGVDTEFRLTGLLIYTQTNQMVKAYSVLQALIDEGFPRSVIDADPDLYSLRKSDTYVKLTQNY